MNKSAILSACRTYRYTLTRVWDTSLPMACFIGLNPSTADERDDDPTIRKCMKYAIRWGFGGILMLNIFGFRATHPRDLKRARREGKDVIGLHGNTFEHLHTYITDFNCRIVVCAWGNTSGVATARGSQARIALATLPLRYLKLNNDGSPAHPLYLLDALEPLEWA